MTERQTSLVARVRRIYDANEHALDELGDCLPGDLAIRDAVRGGWLGVLREQRDTIERICIPFRGVRALRRIMYRLEHSVAQEVVRDDPL